jgi:integrase
MSGLRQGELLALPWTDIDWLAQRIRVRRNFVRGKFGPPKSKRSSRSVPLADVVAAELEGLFRSSAYTADEDLVFGHPHTGSRWTDRCSSSASSGAEASGRPRSSLPRFEAYVR